MKKKPDIQKRFALEIREEDRKRARDDAEKRARECVERGQRYRDAENIEAARKELAQAEKWMEIYKRRGGK